MNINKLSREIYAQNKKVGWWDNKDQCVFEKLQLVSTEIAEATEGERKGLMDDHLTHRKMGEVELADALIRVLDLAGHMEWSFVDGAGPHYFVDKANGIGKQHLGLNMALSALVTAMIFEKCLKQQVGSENGHYDVRFAYSRLVTSIIYCASINSYDIFAAVEQKLIYNTKRLDHKRENRADAGGKKF